MNTIPAIIIARQNRYIRIFRQAGAVSAGNPIRLANYGIRKSVIFDKLLREGILVQVGADRYYLDELREQEVKKRRVPFLVAALILLLVVFFILVNTSK